jgi:hypothetical protein
LNLRRRIMSPSLAALRLQCTPRQTIQTGYGGRIRTYVNEFQRLAPFQLGHSVRIFELVDLARFERATSTFAESRSHSPELQVRGLAEATGVEPARATRGDLANRCHTVRRRLHRLAEGTGLEPASDERGSFQDPCLTS